MSIPDHYGQYWQEELDIELDLECWIESYKYCMRWTVSTELQSVYFQLRMRDIMTNCKPSQMKKKGKIKYVNGVKLKTKLLYTCFGNAQRWNLFGKIKWVAVEPIRRYLIIGKELILLCDVEVGNHTKIINLLILIAIR